MTWWSERRIEQAQTVCLGLAMFALGLAYGGWWVGEAAYQPSLAPTTGTGEPIVPGAAAGGPPEWVGAVQTFTRVAIVGFGMLMLALIGLDYYSRRVDA